MSDQPSTARDARPAERTPGAASAGKAVPDAPAAPQAAEGVDEPRCVLCGSPLIGVHCKLICPNCGYREDCSDPHGP